MISALVAFTGCGERGSPSGRPRSLPFQEGSTPYSRNSELPPAVKGALPDTAQTVWRSAFNSAAKQYGDEQTAFKVAWAAVKRGWKQVDGNWVKKLLGIEKAESLTARVDRISGCWREQTRNSLAADVSWAVEVYDDHIIASVGEDYVSIPFTDDGDDVTFDLQNAAEVQREWTPVQQNFSIEKSDDSKQMVFGWASVAKNADGTDLVDHHGDLIDPADLEDAAYLFTLNFREGDEMHTEEVKMHLVESMVFTPEKLEKFATDEDGKIDADRLDVLKQTFPPAWWVGFHIEDEGFYKRARDEFPMFSIAGLAMKEKVDA